jgi:hypothetical protein
MGRRIYCRFCANPEEIIAGVFPAKCSKCDEVGFWATEPGKGIEPKHKKAPRVPFNLNLNDKKFLRSLRIAQE